MFYLLVVMKHCNSTKRHTDSSHCILFCEGSCCNKENWTTSTGIMLDLNGFQHTKRCMHSNILATYSIESLPNPDGTIQYR